MPKGKGTYGSQVGRPPQDARQRSAQEYAGGGKTGFNRIGARPKLNINPGRSIEGYNPGGGDKFTLDPDVMDAAEAYYEKGGRVNKPYKKPTISVPNELSPYERNKTDNKSKVDQGKYKVGKKGFLTKEGRKQKKIDALASKRDSAPEGSLRRRRLQNRINRLSGSKVKHTAKSEKTKAKTEASWKKATSAKPKGAPTMNTLIKARGMHKKGSSEYNKIQNEINKRYGVSKRHK